MNNYEERMTEKKEVYKKLVKMPHMLDALAALSSLGKQYALNFGL